MKTKKKLVLLSKILNLLILYCLLSLCSKYYHDIKTLYDIPHNTGSSFFMTDIPASIVLFFYLSELILYFVILCSPIKVYKPLMFCLITLAIGIHTYLIIYNNFILGSFMQKINDFGLIKSIGSIAITRSLYLIVLLFGLLSKKDTEKIAGYILIVVGTYYFINAFLFIKSDPLIYQKASQILRQQSFLFLKDIFMSLLLIIHPVLSFPVLKKAKTLNTHLETTVKQQQ